MAHFSKWDLVQKVLLKTFNEIHFKEHYSHYIHLEVDKVMEK